MPFDRESQAGSFEPKIFGELCHVKIDWSTFPLTIPQLPWTDALYKIEIFLCQSIENRKPVLLIQKYLWNCTMLRLTWSTFPLTIPQLPWTDAIYKIKIFLCQSIENRKPVLLSQKYLWNCVANECAFF